MKLLKRLRSWLTEIRKQHRITNKEAINIIDNIVQADGSLPSKIYVAGPITGVKGYRKHFKRAERKLNAAGFRVMNPGILPEGFKWQEYMDICIPMLEVCDAIYLLKGWQFSRGAIQEKQHAELKGKLIMYEGDII